MRILLHDFGGYAFSQDLAAELARKGHEVLYLLSARFRMDRGQVAESPPQLMFHRVDIGRGARQSMSPVRWWDERRYGAALGREITTYSPDVVLSANTPLDSQRSALTAAHRAGAAFVFWVQDVYSQAVSSILGRRLGPMGTLVGRRFARLERYLLRSSDGVVAIADDFRPILGEWGVPADIITVIENWACLDEVQGGQRGHALTIGGAAGRKVVLYAGTLGRKHDPRLLLALARELDDVDIIVVAEGAGADWLRSHAGDQANLKLLPFQPRESLPDLLSDADVLVALLDRDAGQYSVPSKVLTYLAAGKAILGAIPPENLAARTIIKAGAGRVVSPGDEAGLVRAAQELLEDEGLRRRMGEAGRTYATDNFDISQVASRFEQVLTSARETYLARIGASEGRARPHDDEQST